METRLDRIDTPLVLPAHAGLFYGGGWHQPKRGGHFESRNPGTGEVLGRVADGSPEDVDAAVLAARRGFATWRDVHPAERARIMRESAVVIRAHAAELAMLDAADCGNPVREMGRDALAAADSFDLFAGLVTEMKGASIPMGKDAVNFSVREPFGVVARIVAFNHPFMFVAAKAAAPLAAGNAVMIKPPEQASLSALRFAELVGPLLPAGVLSVMTGGRTVGAALSAHRDIAMVTLIGSAATGRAVMRGASETLKPVLLELGGKNALIALADADPDQVAAAAVAGMNFGWCGQSCGSTSRAFIHDAIYDAVIERIPRHVAQFKPGLPTSWDTTMGALISATQHEKVLNYIEIGKQEGARLLCGGARPDAPELAHGFFVEPTVFCDVVQSMRIASEEIFGPVLSVLRWSDSERMLDEVNRTEYGLTCSIWTGNLQAAHRTAQAVQAGYIWVNEVGKHFPGAPFGGFKHSGIGREECLGELLAFTQEKNIHINLRHRD
ncbi:MAG: aldehyde dehydrogenase family protein [Pseudomonadota bacterium]